MEEYMMDEEHARLALLQTELNNLRRTSLSMDAIIHQIKGWCVTTALAIGGFAVTSHKPALLIIGEGAIVGFFVINCHFRMFQRTVYERNAAIDTELKQVGIMEVLKGAGSLDIVGTATWGNDNTAYMPIVQRVRINFPKFWFEISRASTFSLYSFLALGLLVEFFILL